MFGQATLVTSLFMLIFSQSPFGVLIYAILASDATTQEDWISYTIILLIQQLGYTIWKVTRDA